MYKVCCVVAGVILFLPLWALAQGGTDDMADRLAGLRDKSRPLLVFCPTEEDSQLRAQRALFAGREANLKERDVELIVITSHDGGLTSDGVEKLRRRFKVSGGRFTVLLIGKDGGEKFRAYEPVTIEKLDAVIDAMPMRQQEVRDGHHAE